MVDRTRTSTSSRSGASRTTRNFFAQRDVRPDAAQDDGHGRGRDGRLPGRSPFAVAYFLARYVSRRWARLALLVIIVPFWTSYLLRVYSWQAILGEKGALNQVLMALGLIAEPSRLFVYNDFGTFIVLVYVYMPFAALVLYASLERFDFTQLTAAQDLGARPIQAFRHILMPQIRPGLITACIFVFIPILGEFLTPSMVGGASGLLIANLIANFFKNALIPEGAAVGFLIAAFVPVLLIVFRTLPPRRGRLRPWLAASIRSRRCPSAATRARPAGACGSCSAPSSSSSTCRSSSWSSSRSTSRRRQACRSPGFTLHWYEVMLDNRQLLRAVGNSVTVALIVAVLATIIGTMAAFVLVRGGVRYPNAARIAFTLPIMVPGVLIGIVAADLLRPGAATCTCRSVR